MKKIRLGKTDLMVSRVGMGGIPIVRPSLNEAIRVIHRALDLGVNFIDTAAGYGESEERIGRAIGGWSGKRQQVILATKASVLTGEEVTRNIDASLGRLNTDYIDLWQFHNISSTANVDQIIEAGAMEAAIKAKEAGKVLHIGFSTHNPDVAKKAVNSGWFETVQYPFDFIAREAAEELVPLTAQTGVGFIAMKPFAGGNIRNAKLAISFLLQYDNVIPDSGIEKVEEIEEIVGIVNHGPNLTPDDWQEMDQIRAELGTRFCRQCMYCMPCPNGVVIWMVNYVRSLYKLWPREHLLSGWWQECLDSGVHCTGCGVCEPKCPYHLPIRELITANHEFYQRLKNDKINE